MFLYLSIAIVAVVVLLPVGFRAVDRFLAAKILKGILQRERDAVRTQIVLLTELYTTPPEFRPADSGDYPQLDLHFYDETGRVLEELGFHPIGDYEDVVRNRLFPDIPSFTRRFLDGECLHSASVNNIRIRNEKGDLILDNRRCDFGMRFSDGTTLVTSNVGDTLPMDDYGPKIAFNKYPVDTKPSILYLYHKKHVDRYLATHPDVRTVPLNGREAIDEAMVHTQKLIFEDRVRKGLMTDSEIETNFAGPAYGTVDKDVVQMLADVWKEEYHAAAARLRARADS